ncbi:hypothetical protein BDR04DRAFT_1107758 [Suillus decipiens]|nr:hypothetical protein BDR04DRAFT_1107758 [Suillus decipiens]
MHHDLRLARRYSLSRSLISLKHPFYKINFLCYFILLVHRQSAPMTCIVEHAHAVFTKTRTRLDPVLQVKGRCSSVTALAQSCYQRAESSDSNKQAIYVYGVQVTGYHMGKCNVSTGAHHGIGLEADAAAVRLKQVLVD